ncbi:hypothetical protein [Wolbachia endosymbiont (group B) of Rhopobota naevana]|uniref:hypothetical protein n=1 Tax=Wolbachia endosymbiont (group B) of Rhopobota naevana TaxID=2954054 RepID=UPI0022267C2B|nr:hypothetical protein [Wolbachia endosymbiont (group B) of Rhopobota naevana]
MDSRELLAFLHSRARDAVSLYDDVIPARDAGIQSISSQTLFLTYTPTIFCLLHDLLYMDPSVKHWDDKKEGYSDDNEGAGMKGVLDKATCITVAHP